VVARYCLVSVVPFIRTEPLISKPPDFSRMMGFPCLVGLGDAAREGGAEKRRRRRRVRRAEHLAPEDRGRNCFMVRRLCLEFGSIPSCKGEGRGRRILQEKQEKEYWKK
jgi:hypothetical protein